MSVSTEPMTKISSQADASVMGRYKNIVRHRLLIMGVLVLAIFGCLLLDFTMGPSGLTLSSLWQTLIDPASADAGTRVIVWDIRLPYALMLPLLMMSSWKLMALHLGEDRAICFGIDVRRLRLGTLLCISMLSALVLSMASIASKNLIPGVIISVGIVTSLVGVPFFLSIILRHGDHVLMLQNGSLIADGLPEEVITPQSLAKVYGVKGRIERCSQGTPQVLIDGLVTEPTI
ncbi:iron ABC transporter [Yersinia thracica]|uniref:Iron ABC transporter n=1 Tax=Yersinia thracica TaxID=2890319 RepID=A0A0T9NTH5_9GAMM|nr:iron ABC transporter [Yersinia thracica]